MSAPHLCTMVVASYNPFIYCQKFFYALVFIQCVLVSVAIAQEKEDKKKIKKKVEENISIQSLENENFKKHWSIDSLNIKDSFTINKIDIEGNVKTKPHIIYREMKLIQGLSASWSDLKKFALKDEGKLFNLKLFLEVLIIPNQIDNTNKVNLKVIVKERWYTFLFPILDLGSRNFNDWIYNANGNGNRINYGIKIQQENMRGKREILNVRLQGGFAREFGLGYFFPTINKKQNLGLRFYGEYKEYSSIPYKNLNNREVFLNEFSQAAIQHTFFTQFEYRENFFTTHFFDIQYELLSMSDKIMTLNNTYLLNNGNNLNFISLKYQFQIDKRDRQNYGLNGSFFAIELDKKGVGILDNYSQTEFQVDYAKYIPLKHNFFFSGRVAINFSIPESQIFFYNKSLGYNGNFLRGFEVYSFNSESFFLSKFNMKKKLFSSKVYLNNFLKINQFNEIPIDIYLKLFSDHGLTQKSILYRTDVPDINLYNRYISSIGLGLDIVTYYDIVIRIETSYNSLQQTNFALNIGRDLFN